MSELLGLGAGPLGPSGPGSQPQVLGSPVGQVTTSAPPKDAAFIEGRSDNRLVRKMAHLLRLDDALPANVQKLTGPSHFRDIGLVDDVLWGVCVGPRGGMYRIHIDLKDLPRFGVMCTCRGYRPCHHGRALIATADRHFVPPVPPPEGFRIEVEDAYESAWE